MAEPQPPTDWNPDEVPDSTKMEDLRSSLLETGDLTGNTTFLICSTVANHWIVCQESKIRCDTSSEATQRMRASFQRCECNLRPVLH